jgi:hypothetical protein
MAMITARIQRRVATVMVVAPVGVGVDGGVVPPAVGVW